ncbi:MAG: peptidylprolyl isomerase [Clostridium sp.]|jgi:peptidyl-prolyl cis-trans isomerase B (cyclophilin B)|nr:peptidylprolyl isomerase [Clostridium sp.]
MLKKIPFIFLIIVIFLGTAACSKFDDEKKAASEGEVEIEQLNPPQPGDKIAIMTTSMGEIKIRLFPDVAPKAVENFSTHAENGYYDDVIFHRVIEDFMIQGGDPQSTGRGGQSIWGEPFEDEFHNSYCHFRGALSMANRGPNTNGSQFFIVQNKEVNYASLRAAGQAGTDKEILEKYDELGGTPHLDGHHTVFGQVYEGLDIVDKIAAVEVDGNSKPVEDVKIISIEIKTFE